MDNQILSDGGSRNSSERLSPVWSPDSSMIAYLHDNHKIGIYNINNSKNIILDACFPVRTFDWAPNSINLVVCTANDSIEITNIKNEQSVVVAKGYCCIWIKHKNLIAYGSLDNKLNVIDEFGKNNLSLLSKITVAGFNRYPNFDFSYNGRLLAYVTDNDYLRVVPLKDKDKKSPEPREKSMLADSLIWGSLPRFSPNSQFVAISQPDYLTHICNVVTGDKILTIEGGWPSWFADSQKLVYEIDHSIFIASIHGPKPRKLCEGVEPRMSPVKDVFVYCDSTAKRSN